VSIGKLYRLSDNEFVTEVNYQFHDESATSWWGELTLTDYLRINEVEGYIIELEDKRKGHCSRHRCFRIRQRNKLVRRA
jgi:hypothetical protein